MLLFQSLLFFLPGITLISCYLCVYMLLSLYIFLFVLLLSFFFFFLKQAVQSTFGMEEIYHSIAQQLDDERKRRVSAVQTLTIVENNNADLREKLKAEEQQRKSAEVALKGAETQAKSQGIWPMTLKGNWLRPRNRLRP